MGLIFHTDEQGTDAWRDSRRGVITGSMFKVARDKTAKGLPSAKALTYAMDTARERCGGKAQDVYVNAAMRFGTEQEPLARAAYIAATGLQAEQVGFITTDDGKFGLSPDSLVGPNGGLEIKTIVSSNTLFTAVVDGDVSEYIDQVNGYMWLLGLDWVDLVLWVPDLADAGMALNIRRVHRDEDAIEKLEADLIAFEKLVSDYEAKLRRLGVANEPELLAA